jgi:hypothetical protein
MNAEKKIPTVLASCLIGLVALAWLAGPTSISVVSAQSAEETDLVRVGDRFTYRLTVDNVTNAGFAELSVESRGRFRGRDAFEVRTRFKTFDTVNAVFFSIDETRTTFLSAESGVPLAVRRIDDANGFPTGATEDRAARAPAGLDLAALVFKLRQSGGKGKFRLAEAGGYHWVEAKLGETARLKTEAGSFETTASDLTSSYFKSLGISAVKVRLSNDPARIPVLVEFRTSVGPVTARLTSVRLASSAPLDEAGASGGTAPPRGPVGRPYADNQPLGDDIPFRLGERVTMQVRNGAKESGRIQFEALERKMIEGRDSLVLQATVIESGAGETLFARGDLARAAVHPGTLLPFSTDINFKGDLAGLNYSAKFDQQGGSAVSNAGPPITIPVGTHSLLSLIYAVRTFDLRAVRTAGGAGDTRVAVLWDNKPVVFTIRPGSVQNISLDGTQFVAQFVDVLTGDAAVDALKLRFWFTADNRRTPLRISAGTFTADFIPSQSKN